MDFIESVDGDEQKCVCVCVQIYKIVAVRAWCSLAAERRGTLLKPASPDWCMSQVSR